QYRRFGIVPFPRSLHCRNIPRRFKQYS
ncbi:amino ABC transporter, permease, 3-TM region, His/Glu/Gln/Arg/opine family domain protein, partial [Vibrio parahaemolyticus EKP-008]